MNEELESPMDNTLKTNDLSVVTTGGLRQIRISVVHQTGNRTDTVSVDVSLPYEEQPSLQALQRAAATRAIELLQNVLNPLPGQACL